MSQKKLKKVKNSQVVGCRLSSEIYDQLEIKCFEHRIKISVILQKAITEFLSKKN